MATRIKITSFSHRTENQGKEHSLTWEQLKAKLRNPKTRAEKENCPLLKMALFKNATREEGISELVEIYGIEGDYDAERVSIEEAARRLEAAGVEAFIYSSANHLTKTPGKSNGGPRWRVFAPLSRPHSQEDHYRLVSVLNGALGGILAPESFKPKQCYFFGKVRDIPYQTLEISGKCIDELEHAIAPIGKYAEKSQAESSANDAANDLERRATLNAVSEETMADLKSALEFMDPHGNWFDMVNAMASLKVTPFADRAFELIDEYSAKHSKYDFDGLVEKWDACNPDKVTYLSVFKRAQEQGWQNPAKNRTQEPQSGDLLATLRQSIVRPDECDLFDELPHRVEKLVPVGEVTLLAGHGGTGKSYVALSLALHVALGLSFGGLKVTQANVIFFSAEDGAPVLRRRLAKLCRALEIDVACLDGRLFMLDASDMDPALHRETRRAAKTETPLLAALAALVREAGAGLVVIDNASDTYDDDEIKRASVRAFIRALRTHLARPDGAVLLLAHINKTSASQGKGAEDYSGSTAWHNSVRSRLSLTSAGMEALRLEHVKANLGTKATPMRFEWQAGVPIAVDNATAEAAFAAAAAENDESDKAALLEVIRGFDARGERVSTSAMGRSSAFSQMRGVAGFPKRVTNGDKLMQHLRALQDDGRIFRRQYRTPDYKWKECFTAVPPESATNPPNDSAELAKKAA